MDRDSIKKLKIRAKKKKEVEFTLVENCLTEETRDST